MGYPYPNLCLCAFLEPYIGTLLWTNSQADSLVLTNMGGCQNYGPLILNNRCRIIIGTQKGALILTTTHIGT